MQSFKFFRSLIVCGLALSWGCADRKKSESIDGATFDSSSSKAYLPQKPASNTGVIVSDTTYNGEKNASGNFDIETRIAQLNSVKFLLGSQKLNAEVITKRFSGHINNHVSLKGIDVFRLDNNLLITITPQSLLLSSMSNETIADIKASAEFEWEINAENKLLVHSNGYTEDGTKIIKTTSLLNTETDQPYFARLLVEEMKGIIQ